MSSYYTELDEALGAAEEARKHIDLEYEKIEKEGARKNYRRADQARVGSQIACASCGTMIKKTTYHKKFCNNKCKDDYWNLIR